MMATQSKYRQKAHCEVTQNGNATINKKRKQHRGRNKSVFENDVERRLPAMLPDAGI